jgi:hypothetical protein
MNGNTQTDAQFMAQRSLNTTLAFQEHIHSNGAAAETIRQLCEAAWDTGWYSRASGREFTNPFLGDKGR